MNLGNFPQIKTLQQSHELKLIRPQTKNNSTGTQAFKIPNATNTTCRQNCKTLWVRTYYLDIQCQSNYTRFAKYQCGSADRIL